MITIVVGIRIPSSHHPESISRDHKGDWSIYISRIPSIFSSLGVTSFQAYLSFQPLLFPWNPAHQLFLVQWEVQYGNLILPAAVGHDADHEIYEC